MSSSDPRAEVMKPLLIKAGIPAAVSVAAYIFARIISKTSNLSIESSLDVSKQNCSESESPTHVGSFHSLSSTSSDCQECHENEDTDHENLQVEHFKGNLEDKLNELEKKLEELQRREWDLEIRNLKQLQKTRAEVLLKEISIMEEENQRIGEMVTEYIKLVSQIDDLIKENRLLQRKARKHWRRANQRLRIIREQKLSIEAKDQELLSKQTELERKANLIQELEDEVGQLRKAVYHLQTEKTELHNRLELAEKSRSSNPEVKEIEGVTKEKYEEVLKELEQLKKDRAGWNQTFEIKLDGTVEVGNNINHEMHDLHETLLARQDHEPCNVHVHSKRRRLIQKFKKWVDGGKMDEKKKNEMKCCGGNSVSEEAEEQFAHARKSCSSV